MKIFDTHIALEFLKQTLIVTGGLLALVFILQLIDLSADIRAGQSGFGDVVHVVGLRMPFMATEVIFLASFLAALIAFSRLTMSAETTALRALGYSGWRIAFVGAGTIGLFTMLIGPLASSVSASAIRQSTIAEQEVFGGQTELGIFSRATSNQWSVMNIEWNGRPAELSLQSEKTIIEQNRMFGVRLDFRDPTVDIVSASDTPIYTEWMLASLAQITDQSTVLSDVTIAKPHMKPIKVSRLELPFALDIEAHILGAPAPNTLSLWQLLGLDTVMEQSAFRTPLHVLRTHQLISLPLLTFGAVLAAGLFAMRPVRQGRRWIWISTGLIAGTNLFFFNIMFLALGSASVQQAQLTIWFLPVALTLVSIWLYSFLEDS